MSNPGFGAFFHCRHVEEFAYLKCDLAARAGDWGKRRKHARTPCRRGPGSPSSSVRQAEKRLKTAT